MGTWLQWRHALHAPRHPWRSMELPEKLIILFDDIPTCDSETLEMPPEWTASSSIHEISFHSLYRHSDILQRSSWRNFEIFEEITLLYTLNTSHITIGKDFCSYKMQDFSRMFDMKPINQCIINALLNSTGLDAVTYFNKCEWHQINNYVKNGLMYKLSEVVTLYWPKLKSSTGQIWTIWHMNKIYVIYYVRNVYSLRDWDWTYLPQF